MKVLLDVLFFLFLSFHLFFVSCEIEDRVTRFLQRLKQSDVKTCPDPTMMLPGCTECIPGLQRGEGSSSCNEYISSSLAIRNEIKQLVKERFGEVPPERSFGLYPCKSTHPKSPLPPI